jgi:hypothetical protein
MVGELAQDSAKYGEFVQSFDGKLELIHNVKHP